MRCSQYKNLDNYFHIMMPTKKSELLQQNRVSEGYTVQAPTTQKNKSYQDEFKRSYEYGVKDAKIVETQKV